MFQIRASRFGVSRLMASVAEGDQVELGIWTGLTAEVLMMNFQVRPRAAGLAAPGIASKNLLA
jgi:hypothetical protein